MAKIRFISLPVTLTLCKSSHLRSLMFSHSFCVCCIWGSLVTSCFCFEWNLDFYVFTYDFSSISLNNSGKSPLICTERNNRDYLRCSLVKPLFLLSPWTFLLSKSIRSAQRGNAQPSHSPTAYLFLLPQDVFSQITLSVLLWTLQFSPVFLGRRGNKHMPPADTQLWLGSCPNTGETMLISVTLGPGLIFWAWRYLIQSLLGSHQDIMSGCWLQNDTSISRIKITWIFHDYVRYR